jgi:hypothetical protein
MFQANTYGNSADKLFHVTVMTEQGAKAFFLRCSPEQRETPDIAEETMSVVLRSIGIDPKKVKGANFVLVPISLASINHMELS